MSYPQTREHENESAHYNRAFAIALVVKGSFVIIEAVYGFFVHSLALLADAGHNLGDILGLLMGWGVSFLVRRPPTPRYTFGLRRSSILAMLLNAFVLLLVMGGIAWEALRSFFELVPVPAELVIKFAIIGIIINVIIPLLFLSEYKKNWNFRSAFFHVGSDVIVSVGVLLVGIAILTTRSYWFDPTVSLTIVAFTVFKIWQQLRDSLNLAVNAVPEKIEPLAVRTYLTELPGVSQVHNLHIWGISTTETALTVHLVMPDGFPGNEFLERLSEELHDKFSIDHTTFQIESREPTRSGDRVA